MTEQIENQYIPAGNQKLKVFRQSDGYSAYENMTVFLQWSKPKAGQFRTNVDNLGNIVVELVYVK